MISRGIVGCLLIAIMSLPLAAQEEYELSYLLVRTADNEVLASREPDKLRTPASTVKVVTAVAALESLGPETVFSTKLLSEGAVDRGWLRSSLYLVGEADPELTAEHLQQFVDDLVALGLRQIDGDLIVDPGPYSFPVYGPGWAWDDTGYEYSPEVTGLSVNSGVVSLEGDALPGWVSRTEQDGVWLVPGHEGALVGPEAPEKMAAPSMAVRTGEQLRTLMQKRGVKLTGKVRLGQAKGSELASHQSPPLEELLKRALEVSDNLAMELIHRACGKRLPKVLEPKSVRIVDGSGLSRYNLISTRQLVEVLRSCPEIKPLLVRPGEGTLKRRFLDGWAAGNVIGKTGSMGNVSGFVGYLFPDSDKECVFAILINGHLGTTTERKAIEDALVEEWAREIGFPYVVLAGIFNASGISPE